MKFRAYNIAKTICLSIIFSILSIGLYASNLKTKAKTHTGEKQPQKKKVNTSNMQLFNELEIVEEQRELESWMFQLQPQNDPFSEQRLLEDWMLDHEFWHIIEINDNEEIVEEPREVEDWMNKFGINKSKLGVIESPCIHKHLLNQDAFLIL